MPSLIYEGGRAIYDVGNLGGGLVKAAWYAKNSTDSPYWKAWEAMKASRDYHWNPITQRYVRGVLADSPAEVEWYRARGFEPIYKTEL